MNKTLVRSVGGKIFDFLSSLSFALVILSLLFLLTWLSTLEQVEQGLFEVSKKYFSKDTVFFFPELNGKTLYFPLPNAYWVCVLLFINQLLGGIIKIRKGWKNIGVIISHSGILILMIGAFITAEFEKRGNLLLYEGEISALASDYFDYSIEIAEIKDEKISEIHVISGKNLRNHTYFNLANLPFDLIRNDYRENALAVSAKFTPREKSAKVIDGFFLKDYEKSDAAEQWLASVELELKPKGSNQSTENFFLAANNFAPKTIKIGERTFTLRLQKEYWKLPYEIELTDFHHEFHPGTPRPKVFESQINRIHSNGVKIPVKIEMNKPMRHEGITFFQASWGPPDGAPDRELYSVFEVVHNPADQWPKYSLYVTSLGLLIHFIMKLSLFLRGAFSSKPTKPQKAKAN